MKKQSSGGLDPRRILFTTALIAVLVSGCVPAAPTAAIDPAAPNFIDPLPSPTPTFAGPGPDDEDPIADCAIDAPLCVIDASVVEIKEQSYLGVELGIVPIPGKWEPGQIDSIYVNVSVAVQRAGTNVAEVALDHQPVAVVSDGASILTDQDGMLLALINWTEGGLLLGDPHPSPVSLGDPHPTPGFVFQVSERLEDILLIDSEGNTIATLNADGVLLGDPHPSPVTLGDPHPSPSFSISPDLIGTGSLILDAEDRTGALVDSTENSIWLYDAAAEKTFGVAMINGLVVIASPRTGLLALLHTRANPDQANLIGITRLIPIPLSMEGQFDFIGKLELVRVGPDGDQHGMGSVVIEREGIVTIKGKSPGITPTATPVKIPRPTATPAPPKPTSTTVPPKPTATAKPTESGGKPTPTQEK